MKKFAFTLSELLITLTIIGIAAALIAPRIVDIFPDKNKARILKYNVLIDKIITDIMAQEELHHPHSMYSTTTGKYYWAKDDGTQCEGIYCVEGDFGDIFQEHINAIQDGSSWTLAAIDSKNGYKITIDVDKNKAGCSFSPTCLKNIDTFIFKIDKFGTVTPGDALTDAYIRNPMAVTSYSEDMASAIKLVQEKLY